MVWHFPKAWLTLASSNYSLGSWMRSQLSLDKPQIHIGHAAWSGPAEGSHNQEQSVISTWHVSTADGPKWRCFHRLCEPQQYECSRPDMCWRRWETESPDPGQCSLVHIAHFGQKVGVIPGHDILVLQYGAQEKTQCTEKYCTPADSKSCSGPAPVPTPG